MAAAWGLIITLTDLISNSTRHEIRLGEMRSQLTCRRMTEPPFPSTFRLLLVFLIYLFRLIQGNRRTWHCGAHTLINSQETCFVSGFAAAKQMGADYPFDDPEARRSFNYYGNILYGWSFKKAKAAKG